MLALSSSCRYFLYQKGTDMGCGIYSLAGLVRNELKQDPLTGDVFIFIGKRSNQIRLLQWDKDGYALYTKRLEQGTFQWPKGKNESSSQKQVGSLLLTDQELMLILKGIQLESVKLRKRFQLQSTKE
jgi:transposase